MPFEVDLNLFELLFKRTEGRVLYELGAKVPLTADSADVKLIDCSGFSRWILARATNQALILPDGSQNQLAFAREHFRRLTRYSDVAFAGADPSRLFIAFRSPKPGNEWPRHVWFCRSTGRKMLTRESCSSKGVAARRWDTSVLMGCREAFEIVLA